MNRKITFAYSNEEFEEYLKAKNLEKNLTPNQLIERRKTLASFKSTPPGTTLLITSSGTLMPLPRTSEDWKVAREQGDIFVQGFESD